MITHSMTVDVDQTLLVLFNKLCTDVLDLFVLFLHFCLSFDLVFAVALRFADDADAEPVRVASIFCITQQVVKYCSCVFAYVAA